MAHMYQMEPLVIRCCELLVRNLNEQNIFATITAMQKVRGGPEVDELFQDLQHILISDMCLHTKLVAGWLAAPCSGQ